MTQEFNRSKVRELTTEIQKSLNEIGKRLGVEISLGSTTFSPDKFTTKMQVRMISETGSVVISDTTHKTTDSIASRNGVSFETHFIGSIWKIMGKTYKVLEINTRRPHYPVLMLDIEADKKVKCGWSNFRVSSEICSPSAPDFVTWLLIDPDSDAVRESDVEIYDRVDEYFNIKFTEDELNNFYEPVNELDERGLLTKEVATAIAENFLTDGLAEATKYAMAYLALKDIKKRSRK